MKLHTAILCGVVALSAFGAATIGGITQLTSIALGSFPAAVKGGAIFEPTEKTAWNSNGTGWVRLGDASAVDTDAIPTPIFEPHSGDVAGTASSATTLLGSTYRLDRKTTFSKIHVFVTGVGVNPRLRLLIYQTANGTSGVGNLKATVTNFLLAAGVATATPAEGTVTLQPGRFYLLVGQEADAYTLRSYDFGSAHLVTFAVPAALPKYKYTTSIASSGVPASTFDPISQATASTGNVTPVIRLSQ